MHDLSNLVRIGAGLSLLSFLLFVGLAIERTLELRRMHKNAVPQNPLAAGAQSGFLEGTGKVLEAAAKLTDALAKAPLAVVAVVASLLFLIVAIGAAALECGSIRGPKAPESRPGAPVSMFVPGQRCVVRNFGDADGNLPATADDAPKGCLDRLGEKMRAEKLGVLLMIGRCDVRELRPKARRIYTDNFTLAYQRAMAVQDYLLHEKQGAWAVADAEVAEHAIVLAAGAAHLSDDNSHGSNPEDRAVELLPFWIQRSS